MCTVQGAGDAVRNQERHPPDGSSQCGEKRGACQQKPPKDVVCPRLRTHMGAVQYSVQRARYRGCFIAFDAVPSCGFWDKISRKGPHRVLLFVFWVFFGNMRASHCFGLSRCGAQAPDAQAQQPWLTGPATPRHVGSFWTGARTHVPASAGGLSTTAPPGKPNLFFIFIQHSKTSGLLFCGRLSSP